MALRSVRLGAGDLRISSHGSGRDLEDRPLPAARFQRAPPTARAALRTVCGAVCEPRAPQPASEEGAAMTARKCSICTTIHSFLRAPRRISESRLGALVGQVVNLRS